MSTTMLVYETDGEFNPADFPGLQYVRVRAVGGGGGSSGVEAPTYGQTFSTGAGGGSGDYAESLLNASDLPGGPIPIWVGKGGAGSAPGATAGNGTLSSFGGTGTPSVPLTGMVVALWGTGGGSGNDQSDPGTPSSAPRPDWQVTTSSAPISHAGAFESVGQLVVKGGAGEPSFGLGQDILGAGNTMVIGGAGGQSLLSGRNAGFYAKHRTTGAVSYGGSTFDHHVPYGGGAVAPTSTTEGAETTNGFDGAPGVVIVEVYMVQVTL